MPINFLPPVFTERRKRPFGERLWSGIRRLSVRELLRTHDEPLLAGLDYLSREFTDDLEPAITRSRKRNAI